MSYEHVIVSGRYELTELIHLLSSASSSHRTELFSYTAEQESEGIKTPWSVRICEDANLTDEYRKQRHHFVF